MYFPLDTARCRTLAGRAAYTILLKTTGTTGDPVVAGGWSRRSILMGSRGGSARKSDILPRGIAFNCCWVSVTVVEATSSLFLLFILRLLTVSCSCSFLRLESLLAIVECCQPREYYFAYGRSSQQTRRESGKRTNFHGIIFTSIDIEAFDRRTEESLAISLYATLIAT